MSRSVGESSRDEQEVPRLAANPLAMDEQHQRLVSRVADEQDDVLGTIQLVVGDRSLHDRLFDQLVDLLVEGMFLDLRDEYLSGELDHEGYVAAITDLADRCREQGLLPLPSRNI